MVFFVVFGAVFAGNGDQQPTVWDALAKLRGKELSVDQIQDLYTSVVPRS